MFRLFERINAIIFDFRTGETWRDDAERRAFAAAAVERCVARARSLGRSRMYLFGALPFKRYVPSPIPLPWSHLFWTEQVPEGNRAVGLERRRLRRRAPGRGRLRARVPPGRARLADGVLRRLRGARAADVARPGRRGEIYGRWEIFGTHAAVPDRRRRHRVAPLPRRPRAAPRLAPGVAARGGAPRAAAAGARRRAETRRAREAKTCRAETRRRAREAEIRRRGARGREEEEAAVSYLRKASSLLRVLAACIAA